MDLYANLQWFRRHVKLGHVKQPSVVKVYLHLLAEGLALNGYLISGTTCRAIAEDCDMSNSTAWRSLTKLEQLRVIKRLSDGNIVLLAPPKNFCETLRETLAKKQPQPSLFNACKTVAGVTTPSQREVVTTPKPAREPWEDAVSPALGGKRLTSDKYLGKTFAELLKMREEDRLKEAKMTIEIK